jgi:HK97 gp10 family phage protein
MLKFSLTAKSDVRTLTRLPRRVRQTLERVVAEEAAETVQDARQRAPRDTGALQESIHAVQTGVLQWEVRDGVPYGIFQEFGTQHHAATPFMTPALHAAELRLDERLRTALNETLRSSKK